MSNIILRREVRRLEQISTARIWGPVLFKRAEKAIAILADCFQGAVTSFEPAVKAIAELKDLWKKIPWWKRLWLRICFWIENIFKGEKQ